MIESLPDRPLSENEVKALVREEGIKHAYGMVIGDFTEKEYGVDVNIGLNADGGLDHDFYLDVIIDTGGTVAVAAYPRPDLPPAEELGVIDDPMEPVIQEEHEWEWIYREPRSTASIHGVVAALKEYRDFSDQEEVWIDAVAYTGVLGFIND